MEESSILVYRVLTLLVMVGFLPVCAYTYYAYRLGQRKVEIERILRVLEITSEYRKIYIQDIGRKHFGVAVMFTMSVSAAGFTALLLSKELGIGDTATLLLGGARSVGAGCDIKCLQDYQHGAMLAFGLGFLGAYVWGLQGLFRRYSMNDLLPIAFYHYGLRMILSAFIALLIYHAVDGFSGAPFVAPDSSQIPVPSRDGMLLVSVFLVGMFPQRGLRWLSSKVSLFGSEGHSSVKPLPLDMIQGMTSYDVFRLEELGIDNCYDLANADYIPVLLKTSYGARELIDWILQAKLCVRFGDAIEELRAIGIRTITDLDGLEDEDFEELSKQTPLTINSLHRAVRGSITDQNIDRLKDAATLLSQYWEGGDKEKPAAKSAAS